MVNKLLNKASIEMLMADLKSLGSAIKLAKKYGVSPSTVYETFNSLDIDCYVRATNVDKIFTKEMLEKEYTELQSFSKIATKYNVSHETVRHYIHKYKIDYNHLTRYDCDHDFFTRVSEEVFYVAGFAAADGCVKSRKQDNNPTVLYFGLAQGDKPHIEMIRDLLKSNAPIKDFLVKNSKQNPKWKDTWKSEISITSAKLCADISKFEITQRKSMTLKFPEWLIEHPLVHHFMRGYNDGDGSFFKSKLHNGRTVEQVNYSVRGTPEFLSVYRKIFERECGLEERTKPIRISSGQGVLEYGGNGVVKKICQFLYKNADHYLGWKHDIIKHLL